jgi:hypothetical protein
LETIPVNLLTDSNISLISYDGNRFDEKAFQGKQGYDQVNRHFAKKISKSFISFFSIWNDLRLVDENLNRHFFLMILFILLYKYFFVLSFGTNYYKFKYIDTASYSHL